MGDHSKLLCTCSRTKVLETWFDWLSANSYHIASAFQQVHKEHGEGLKHIMKDRVL